MSPRAYAILLAAGLALLAGPALAGSMKWEKKLDSDVRFKMIHDSGLIVAGTTGTVYGFNPETGEEKWKIEKVMKNYDPQMVQPQPGSEFMVYVFKKNMFDVAPQIRCLNILTGELVWEWELGGLLPDEIVPKVAAAIGVQAKPDHGAALYTGAINAVIDDEERDQFLLCSYTGFGVGVGEKLWNPLLKEHVLKSKPQTFVAGVLAVEKKTGKVKWVSPVLALDSKNKPKVSYVWSYPQRLGDKLLLDWAGVHVFDLKDGKLVCAAPFDRSNFNGANAPTVIDNGVAYVSSAGQLTAVDLGAGKIKWQTKPDKKVVYSEVYVAGDKVVVKRGGAFEEKPGKMKQFPYGLDVLDRNTGQPLFDSMKLHKSKERQITDMTNLVVDGNTAYYASQKSLRAFDLDKSDYKYQVALGEDQGNFDGVKSVSLDNGKLYVLMKQTTKAFNSADGSPIWSKSIEPPKVSKLALALLNTLSAMEAQQRANNSMSGRAKYRTYGQADFYKARSASTSAYNYVMSKENDKPTIVGVNLGTGKDDRRATMDKQEADYIVDERWGLLVNVEKKETLQVYDMNE